MLKDPEKRAAYDQLGANWKSGQDFNPPPDWDADFEFSGGSFEADDAATFSVFLNHCLAAGRGMPISVADMRPVPIFSSTAKTIMQKF